MKGIVKKMLWTLGLMVALVVLLAVTVVSYLKFSPRTGKAPEGDYAASLAKSPNYSDGRFVNLIATSVGEVDGNMIGATYSWLFEGKDRVPPSVLPSAWDAQRLSSSDESSGLRVTWFGHSTVMLQIDGKNLMLDPMFGDYASPIPLVGKRFATEQPIPVEALPHFEAVLISHDHYDHLDHGSIQAIKDKTEHFYVPLGVGGHLRYWGVPDEKITELDWWDEVEFHGLKLTAAPARHFSGRALPESNPTLWVSWILEAESIRVYYSGDGGYSPTFKEIGERFGPFDFTMIECGQYNKRWADIHLMPEQAVQAQLDLRGKVMMPIHWGAFNLSLHSWDEPVTRLVKEADRLGVSVAAPLIGQTFGLDVIPSDRWWERVR